MNREARVRGEIQTVLDRMAYQLWLLGTPADTYTRGLLLQGLRHQLQLLHLLVNQADEPLPPAATPGAPVQAGNPEPAAPDPALPVISRGQLGSYTGRNGNPAYVAVNGIVYDVTNHRGWSAATHFGLAAGRDLTAEFSSCHAIQPWILTTLKKVGRLA